MWRILYGKWMYGNRLDQNIDLADVYTDTVYTSCYLLHCCIPYRYTAMPTVTLDEAPEMPQSPSANSPYPT